MKLPKRIVDWYVNLVRGNHKLPAEMETLPKATCLNCGTEYRGHF